MADEKLPHAVEVALAAAVTAVDAACRKALGITETYTARDRIDELRLAIHRFAREREAAALERAAKAVSALCFSEIERLGGLSADRPHEFKFGPGVQSPRLLAMNDALAAIRALIHKEPANGS